MHFELVETEAALAPLCARWMASAAIAVDTEFERVSTYHARLGLVQVSDGVHHALVDPLALGSLSGLREVLRAPRVLKVLHAASEDLEVLGLVDAAPAPFVDTQIEAALAGAGDTIGYRALVKDLLGHDIPKDATRSKWLRRPLAPGQLHYAALDVAHLLACHRLLEERIHELGRRHWLEEECLRLGEAVLARARPENAYLRIGGAWRLSARGFAVLRELAALREREAKRIDVPRSRLASDTELLDIAASADPMSASGVDRLGDPEELRRALRSALEALPGELPEPPPAPVDGRTHAATIRRLQRAVKHRAQILGVPVALLASKRVVESVVRHTCIEEREGVPEPLAGWRATAIGEELIAVARETGSRGLPAHRRP